MSQRQAGWVAAGDRYDDGGFSGAILERPAMQRLLAPIDAGNIDCVVVYKVTAGVPGKLPVAITRLAPTFRTPLLSAMALRLT